MNPQRICTFYIVFINKKKNRTASTQTSDEWKCKNYRQCSSISPFAQFKIKTRNGMFVARRVNRVDAIMGHFAYKQYYYTLVCFTSSRFVLSSALRVRILRKRILEVSFDNGIDEWLQLENVFDVNVLLLHLFHFRKPNSSSATKM